MATRYYVADEGGFILGVPGTWPAGSVVEVADDGTATLVPAETPATPEPAPEKPAKTSR